MNKLFEQFTNMSKMPMFELTNSNGEFEVYTILANEAGLQVLYTGIFQPWDDIFSLDEHLQAIAEQIQEKLY